MSSTSIAKISVIIPIYKCEMFLSACLESVLNQTFRDIEIICVDDFTPDDSVLLVKKFQKMDPRVRLIRHDQNLGLGGARNSGIKAATTEFLASVDSDDTMKPHMLESLWNASENGFYDIVSCGFDRIDTGGAVVSTQKSANRRLHDEGIVDIFRAMNPAFWNKLWRRSLFIDNNIWFPMHLYYQDAATTPRILAKARRIRIIDQILYNYVVRPDSITTTCSPKHTTDYFKVFDIIADFLENEGLNGKYFDDFFRYVDRSLSHHANTGVRSSLDEEAESQYLKHLILFKTGYLERRKLLAGKSSDELRFLAGKAHTTADLLPDDGRPILPLSIIVKTFLRPRLLERFLISVGQYEEQCGVRFSEILVGDDSPAMDISANARVIQKVRELHPHTRIKHHVYEEDIGLSSGRNRLVAAATEDYVLLCDDDFILDDEADISSALEIAKQGQYQIVGGWLKNKYDLRSGTFVYWGAFGELRETDEELIINLDELPLQRDLIPSEYLLNFFVADRKSLLCNKWDESLKVEEHQEFFYRFKHNQYKAVLFSRLFVKHTADRSENPPRYNSYRFSGENWQRFLFTAPARMRKRRRTINRRRIGEFERWTVDAHARKSVHTVVPLREPILAQSVPTTRVSPPFDQCFGGYYDIRLVSNDGRYVLCQTAPATDRLPEDSDVADVLIIDIWNGNDPRVIGTTSAWCHQQGSHAQFMHGAETRVIYNVFDEVRGALASREIDIETDVERYHRRPVSALSPDGKTAASLNFSRLYDYRPGYGYAHVPDKFADVKAPSEDGLWLFDLQTGAEVLAISYDEARQFLRKEGFSEVAEGKLIFNHVAFNTDGTAILVLLRTFSGDAPFPTFTIVCDADGSNLRRVFGFCSHYHWKDADTLLLSGGEGMTRSAVGQLKVFEIDIRTGQFKTIGSDVLYDDGHCSYSPDRQFLLYDSYCNTSFPYRNLMLYRFRDGKALDLGYFYSPGKWFNNKPDLRCDLHPRWSPDGKSITFDSIHEGWRGVYLIEVKDALNVFDSTITRFTKRDLMLWYATKYGGSAKPQSTPTPEAGPASVNATSNPARHEEGSLATPRPFYVPFGLWLKPRYPRAYRLLQYVRRFLAGFWRRRTLTLPVLILVFIPVALGQLPSFADARAGLTGLSVVGLTIGLIGYLGWRVYSSISSLNQQLEEMRGAKLK